jgi:hydrogenase-1 operon protein HyaF
MKDFPIPVVSLDALSARVGPNSQPTEDDGFDYLPLPSGMPTFDLPRMPESTDPAATAAAIDALQAVLDALRGWPFGEGANPSFDLSALPAAALAVVNDALGQGEVSAIVRGTPQIHIQETVFTGLWRVQCLDAAGQLLSDTLEAGAIPTAVATAAAAAPPPATDRALPPLIEGVMNAQPVLHELLAAARAYRPGDPAHVVNLSLLPMTPSDLAWLGAALGDGPATVLSRGYGNCRITATALPATWRVQYFNNDDKLILDTIEVTDIPDVALAAAEDFADSLLRLAEWVVTLREGLEDDARDV